MDICDPIFGKAALLDTTWQTVDPLVIGIPVSTVVLLLGTYIVKRDDKTRALPET